MKKVRGRCSTGGFTVLEVMLVTSMMMTVLATVSVGIRAGNSANEELRRRSVLTAMSSDLMDRLFSIRFGEPGDGEATAAQLSELFDDDDLLGNITLSGMRKPPGVPGYTFQFANFPYDGTWEVRVNADLNGDGDEDDAADGQGGLFRINLYYDGVLILESMRTSAGS